MKTRIHFIVNPIAGSGKNELTSTFLQTIFDKNSYEITIKNSQYAKHALILAKESLQENPSIIVACGGDGTINEVASCLVNTKVALGIVPMGSGNGLATNLSIPKNILKAVQIIKNAATVKIDTGTVNGLHFFSNMGIGFDAHVISNYEKKGSRKLASYFKSVISALKSYDYSKEFEIHFNTKTEIISPFLLFVSNSNEMGYSMSLTPKASLQDGLFDIIIVPKLSAFKMMLFTLLFLFKKHYWLKEVRMVTTDAISVKHRTSNKFELQKDGEYLEIKKELLEIKLQKKSLSVCVN